MELVWRKAVLAAGLVLVSYEAGALPFISFDPRASAMGGAGVASASGVSAGFVNPALLMEASDHAASGMVLPVMAELRFSNPRNIQDEVERYQRDNLEANFETALINFKGDAASLSLRKALVTATQELAGQLNRFSARSAEREFDAAVAVAVPGKKMAVMVDMRAISSGKLVNVEKDFATYAGVINGLNKNFLPTDDAFNVIVSAPDRNLQTTLLGRGATIYEVGLALAKEVSISGHKVAAGITPKYVDVTTFDYAHTVDVATFNADEGRSHYASFNLDLGMVKEYADGWKSAIAVRNLIPREYPTVLGGSVTIQPQLRAGVTHSNDWLTTVVDVDLNKSKGVGYATDTQYLGLGGEVDITKTMKLRAGYRYNISDNQTSAVTAGVGVVMFGIATDVAVAINEDELGMSARLGLHF